MHVYEHCRGVDVLKGDVADKLPFTPSTDFHEVGPEVVHMDDGSVGGDDGLDLPEVFLGFAQEFLSFTIV